MRFRRIAAAAALLLAASSPAVAQTVVDFEDIHGTIYVPAGYGGIQWIGPWYQYDWAQPPYAAHSGSHRAYFGGDGAPSFGFVGGPATFQGAWFAGHPQMAFHLFLDGSLVHTTGAIQLSGTSTWLGSGYSGMVDLVVLSTDGLSTFVIDDVTYGGAAAPTVTPEPGTVVLMATGLFAVGGIVRRRRRRAAQG